MNTERAAADMVAVVERMLVEGFAGGDVSVVDELVAPHVIEHQFGLEGVGAVAIGKIKQGMIDVHTAFPDLHFTLGDWVVSDDIVWVRAEGAGTNTGPFIGPPTGAPVRFTVIDIARIVEGRIVEHWGVPDRFEILVRTGRLAPPASAA